jgi:hypothetical protein
VYAFCTVETKQILCLCCCCCCCFSWATCHGQQNIKTWVLHKNAYGKCMSPAALQQIRTGFERNLQPTILCILFTRYAVSLHETKDHSASISKVLITCILIYIHLQNQLKAQSQTYLKVTPFTTTTTCFGIFVPSSGSLYIKFKTCCYVTEYYISFAQ